MTADQLLGVLRRHSAEAEEGKFRLEVLAPLCKSSPEEVLQRAKILRARKQVDIAEPEDGSGVTITLLDRGPARTEKDRRQEGLWGHRR